ncbi:dimethylglycine dehydrogenase [Pseudomonas syringae]|uniref:Dimethylglycine dehydrogenase n=1 Tax=Pseudomonas syringae TaxID=317 RepID=A0A1C7ZBD7_PSESX|nr:DJ-1/PfpI family protein [Pseudomonas syringae]OCR26426.1 dimethylglycine dehydrogenase [Pseudomonas syringae]
MTLHIGLLVFPSVQQLDLTGPYEVFATLPDVRVHLVWKNLDPLLSSTGLALQPTQTFADCPVLDVLCIPGGKGIDVLLEDAETLAFIKRQGATVKYLTSVCTGALVLGAAGLLQGKRATTHWASHDLLEKFGAIAVHERVVRDGNLMTGGGVTAGIDFALTLASELFDALHAQTVQLQLEYAPAPPFNAGHPDTAPAEVLALARERGRQAMAQRRAIVERVAGGEV